MRNLEVKGTAVVKVSRYDTVINGVPLRELIYEKLGADEFKDFYAKVNIVIEPLEVCLMVNGEKYPEG